MMPNPVPLVWGLEQYPEVEEEARVERETDRLRPKLLRPEKLGRQEINEIRVSDSGVPLLLATAPQQPLGKKSLQTRLDLRGLQLLQAVLEPVLESMGRTSRVPFGEEHLGKLFAGGESVASSWLFFSFFSFI
ncbi:unnamed protein product [Sphagnum jensenii]